MAERNAAIICINKEFLLNWLQFEGGTIHRISIDPDVWNPNTIELLIEHPDLDRVEDGFLLRRVSPMYMVETEIVNGKESHRIERVGPPKKEIVEDGKTD